MKFITTQPIAFVLLLVTAACSTENKEVVTNSKKSDGTNSPASGTVETGNTVLAKSTDECAGIEGGLEKIKCYADLPHVKKITSEAGKIYLISQKGAYVSSDGGNNFSACGEIKKEPKDLLVNNGKVFVSTGEGIFVSKDNCAHFAKAGMKIDKNVSSNSYVTSTMSLDGGTLAVLSEWGILFSSDDAENFKTATYIYDRTSFVGQIMNIDAFVIHKGSTVFGFDQGIAQSASPYGKDMGVAKVASLQHLPAMKFFGADAYVAAATNKGLFLSEDGGRNFAERESNIKGIYTNDVFYRNDTLYVITGNASGLYSGDGALAVSTDKGTSYTLRTFAKDSSGSSSAKMMGEPWPISVYVDSGIVFVGTSNGLFRSKDNGAHFEKSVIAK